MKKIVNNIALIGATSRTEKYGNIILRDLLKKNYTVYPVHPVLKEIEKEKVFNNISSLPENVDLYVFVVPWEVGLKTVRELIKSGKNNFWFQPGAGNSEIESFFYDIEGINYSFNRCIMVSTMIKGDLKF